MSLASVILAAGKGKRMNTNISKVLHPVGGEPMIVHALRVAKEVDSEPIVVVLGHNGEQVESHLEDDGHEVRVAWQEQLLGTGDAVKQAIPHLGEAVTNVLVICGDTPLLRKKTVEHLVASHFEKKPALTVLTSEVDDPTGYGRIIRDKDGFVTNVIEESDATKEQKAINEINSGVYVFEIDVLREYLKKLDKSNAQGEYYLTKVVALCMRDGLRVDAVKADDASEVIGVNSRIELAEANKIFFRRRAVELMDAGVTIIDPDSTYIESQVEVGKDTVIYPGCHLRKGTVIGEKCRIGPNCDISGANIGNEVKMSYCVVVSSVIEDGCEVGPYAYLRPESEIFRNARIGTFVEIKKTKVGEESKVPHLSYMGDAVIGKNVNVGAGSITCNYDGENKYQTIIDDDAFIGSDTMFVAPVEIGRGAYTGAGSVICKNVPPENLGIARSKQINKESWAKKKKSREGE